MSLRELYADNGARGDNVRNLATDTSAYQPADWNPVYCVYGWPHLQIGGVCVICGVSRTVSPSSAP